MDIEEMNHQVNIMGRIYERAKRTVIWYSALDSTGLCPRNYPAQGDLDVAKTLCTGGDEQHIIPSVIRQSLREHLDHLQQAKSTSLWNWRLWCVQEFWFSYLDPTVCVGRHVIEWKKFPSYSRKSLATKMH
ncbi:hypothetical protein MRB53_041675 [Persea americana]|nr:hypothetical protein MRB53_041675 [Persea americana]